MADLRKLIEAYVKAKAMFDAADENNDAAEWDAYDVAERAIVIYPCQTVEDVRQKARFFLDNYGPNDTLRNCGDETGTTLDWFLHSLLGAA